MVSNKLKYGFFTWLVVLNFFGTAQPHLFSEISVNKNSAFKGEPVEVRVSVYTSTWFTSGVNPGNVKVDGAFTIYFRSVSESRKIDGKTYAGVSMIFNVFPYEDNDIVFPAVKFQVETPDAGGFQGIKRTIETKAKTIKVKPIPEGYDIAQWLVSANVSVEEKWVGNINEVKVGDVVERIITRTVAGNVSGLIPPLLWDTVSGTSTYISRSNTKDEKSRTRITAKRTDGIKYLFEKEGKVTIPEMAISWWDPANKRFYKRTLKEKIIEVQHNPDPGMLESIRDSLAVAQNDTIGGENKESRLEILGLTLKQFITLIVLSAIIIYLLIRGIKRLIVIYSNRRKKYLQSELYYFRLFQKAIKQKQKGNILNALYKWIDMLNLPEPTAICFTIHYGNENLKNDMQILEGNSESVINLNSETWKIARKKYLQGKSSSLKRKSELWINYNS